MTAVAAVVFLALGGIRDTNAATGAEAASERVSTTTTEKASTTTTDPRNYVDNQHQGDPPHCHGGAECQHYPPYTSEEDAEERQEHGSHSGPCHDDGCKRRCDSQGCWNQNEDERPTGNEPPARDENAACKDHGEERPDAEKEKYGCPVG
jgi:hypothetical protein